MTQSAISARSSNNGKLLCGCALALVLAVTARAPDAQAQAFQGTPTVVGGSANAIVSQGPTQDTITVFTNEVVINWVPTDSVGTGTIDFLPANRIGLFEDSTGQPLADFTVLNRIQPVDINGAPTLRPIAFNGTVRSLLSGVQGGNVWFYSPGGIIAGAGSIFDVGGLVLTTSDIDTTGGLAPGGQIRFTGTANNASSVFIEGAVGALPSAQINALATGSYVALVAPRVVQAGTVNVDGSVAYVGAEAVDITINSGLFNITIGTGTDDAQGVVHTGATNLTPDAGTQRAFLAAVPKNNALTMLLTGNFGYTVAATAAIQDGAVILSAGHDIAGGQSIDTPNGSTTAAADISVGNSRFEVIRSFGTAIDGRASGSITINPTGGGTIQFDDSAAFKAGTSITVGADDGETINAANGLDLNAGRDGTGGTATLYANGALTPGQITVAGTLSLSSDGRGLNAATAGASGEGGTGGTTQLLIDGGRVTADTVFMSADGFGGNGFDGGNGTGGSALVSVQDGQLGVTGSLFVTADGYGGAEEIDGTSGDGLGGTVLIEMLPGSANSAAIATNSFSASASGYGVPIPGDYFASGNGGLGQGGSVRFDLLGGTLSVTTDMGLGATGLGGQAASTFSGPLYTAGNGTGGQATFNLDGGFADVASLSIFSTGEGGFAQGLSGGSLMGIAGSGTAGISQFIASSGTMTVGDLFVHAYGVGGATDISFDTDSTDGGDGLGGTAEFAFNGADLTITALDLAANGEGGAGGEGFDIGAAGSGGNGTGGTATMTLGPGNLTLTGFAIAGNGIGGAGGNQSGTGVTGSGGDGFGGSAILEGLNADYAFAAVTLEGRGLGGAAGTGGAGGGITGNGTGGLARVGNADTAAPVLGRSMASLTLDVGGTGATVLSGRAEISDIATFAGGGLVISGALNVQNAQPVANANSGFYYTGAGEGISIGGNATIDVAGNVEFAVNGTGTFDVAGVLDVTSGQNILVSHANQPATPADSISANSMFFTGSAFDAGVGTVLNSATTIDIVTLGGNLGSAGNLLANGFVNIQSAADTLINDAMVTGNTLFIRGPGAVQITGTVVAGDDVDVLVGGAVTANDLTAIAGDVDLETLGGIALVQASAGDEISLASRDGSINAGTLISGTGLAGGLPGDSYSTGALAFGGVTVSSVTSATDAGLASLTGDVVVVDQVTAGGSVGAFAANDIILGSLDAGQFVYLAGVDTLSPLGSLDPPIPPSSVIGLPPLPNAGTIVISGDLTAGQALVSAGTDFTVQGTASVFTDFTALAGGAINLPDLTVGGTLQVDALSATISSPGTLTVSQANATGGDLMIFASDGLTLGDGAATGGIVLGSTLGDLSVTDLTGASVEIGTFGTANFAGLTQGQVVQVNSGDIVIGAGAQIGVAGTTTTLNLGNGRTANPTFIGGVGSTAGYSLSAAEMTRLFSDDIEIVGTFGGATGPDVVVDSFTMTSRAGDPGGNLGANGSLSIVSAGNIDIIGDVALTELGSGNQLFFFSEGAVGRATIAVDAATASISLDDGNGALIGQLNFDAGEVFVATQSAIADVQAASDTDAITERLALNDGVARNSVISAGTIFADVSGGLYIQNTGVSGAFADRRGFAALTNTLDVATRLPTARIVVNGILVDGAGGTITGTDVLPLVRINGVTGATSGNFDSRSTVNGCLVSSPALCTLNLEEIPNLPPPHDFIEEPLDPSEISNTPRPFPTMVVELKEFEPFGYPPLIDEPVTGAGNDDLWMPACEGEAREGCVAP